MTAASSPGSAQELTLRVIGIEPAGRDTRLFRLEDALGQALPGAEPGAHITLIMEPGLERQYSLLHPGSAPATYDVAVRREAAGRGGSAFLHERLQLGDTIAALAPRNDFALEEAASTSVLIGGGIGVTPLIAMAERLTKLGRSFSFHAAFRSPADSLLAEELAQFPQLIRHIDDEAGGYLPLAQIIAQAPREAHFYCCGPAAMIDSFLACARADGREEAQIHVEYFTAQQPPRAEGSFIVELARSGLTLTVQPGKSILETVREAGVEAVSSCEMGTCGACETKVLEGIPDHFDAVLSPKDRREGKSMMICCSGSLSDRLVLDL